MSMKSKEFSNSPKSSFKAHYFGISLTSQQNPYSLNCRDSYGMTRLCENCNSQLATFKLATPSPD